MNRFSIPNDRPAVTGLPKPLGLNPQPLARATLTVSPPWDPWPVTLEIIVLASSPHEDAAEVTRHGLPELREAGWDMRSHANLDIYTRTIS